VPLGEARNLAIAKARGQYIAFLDCDDIWLPEKLELQLASFNRPSSREIGFSYTDAMRIDSKGADLLSYSQEKQLAEGDVYINLIYSSFIACSAGMIKSAVLSEIGGFDPDFEFVEEWDLWIRIASQYDLACVNKPLTKIRIHSNNASKNIEGQFHEKMRLARLIMSRDQTVTRHCQKAIKFAEVQFRLSKLLLAKEVKQKFISLARALYTMVKAPVISLTLIKRHLSIDILRAFRKKYLSGEPHAA